MLLNSGFELILRNKGRRKNWLAGSHTRLLSLLNYRVSWLVRVHYEPHRVSYSVYHAPGAQGMKGSLAGSLKFRRSPLALACSWFMMNRGAVSLAYGFIPHVPSSFKIVCYFYFGEFICGPLTVGPFLLRFCLKSPICTQSILRLGFARCCHILHPDYHSCSV